MPQANLPPDLVTETPLSREDKRIFEERLRNLVHPSFKSRPQKEIFEIENKDPQYLPGDIVYLIPNYNSPSESNPTIGSRYEIDCKILSSFTQSGNTLYTVITGQGVHINTTHNQVVKASDKYKFYKTQQVKLKESIDICDAGTIFVKEGDYYINDFVGIYLHATRVEDNVLFEKLNNN